MTATRPDSVLAQVRTAGVGQLGDGSRNVDQAAAVQRRTEDAAQVGDVLVLQRLGQIDHPLLDAPAIGDQHQQQPGGRHRDDLDVADLRPRERRVLDDRHLAGQLGEQPHAAAHHVVEVDRAFEEGLDGAPLGDRHRLDAWRAGRRRAGSPCRSGIRPALVCGWTM